MSRESALKNATIDSPNFDTPTWEAAATRKAQSLGITLPKDFKTVAHNYANSHTGVFDWANKTLNNVNALVDSYAQNPKAFYEKAIYEAGYKYATTKVYTNSADSAKAEKYADADKNMAAIIGSAYGSGIPLSSIQKLIQDGENYVVQDYNQGVKNNSSWLDTAFALVTAVGVGVLTAGLGSAIAAELGISAIGGNAIAGALVGVAQGQDPATALRNGIASAGGAVAGEEVLKGMKGITDPAVANVFANSVKYGSEAALKGQDILKALEAGAAGGAVAAGSTAVTDGSTTMSAQDQKGIAKALGTFTAARMQGLSTEQALASATAGFAASDVERVKQEVLRESSAENKENISSAGNIPTGGVKPSTSTSDDKALQEQFSSASSSLYDPALLSNYQVTKQAGSQQFPVTKKFQNNVLLGYINQTPGLPGVKTFGYNPQSASQNISQAASAQALQTGSPDSPFQDPKEGGQRKNVWNQASLRTMDETGSTA